MATPKLTKLELKIMEILWTKGNCSVREIQESFPTKNRPAYTTIQTTVNRMEIKKIVDRVKKIGNTHIFAAAVSRSAAQRRLIDDLLGMLGGHIQPVVAHLVKYGKLTTADVEEAEKALRELERKEKP
jgi:BlaI family transcriptional regulator, penicillinase repressor